MNQEQPHRIMEDDVAPDPAVSGDYFAAAAEQQRGADDIHGTVAEAEQQAHDGTRHAEIAAAASPTTTPRNEDAIVPMAQPSSRDVQQPLPRSHSKRMRELQRRLNKMTAVDGQGMWRSWTRVFARPESACLDLLDNCLDAALHPNFHGRVTMDTCLEDGIAIQNNSQAPIKPLEDALIVYHSSKNSNLHAFDADINNISMEDKDAIGENGVGLKHGSATLSDCSLVFTRNGVTIEIGVIAKGLQTPHGVHLPFFAFNIHNPALIGVEDDVRDRIQHWLSKNPDIEAVIADALVVPGHGSSSHDDSVVEQLTKFTQRLFTDFWRQDEHVFLLVLCNLKKTSSLKQHQPQHDLMEATANPQGPTVAKAFLHTIQNMLPEYYINLSDHSQFTLTIDQKPVYFQYWQRRLVELSRFTVYIPTDVPLEKLPDDTWDKPSHQQKYPLSIYCGFDAQRLDKQMSQAGGTSACSLLIYSCQAGRLIQKETDARFALGLGTSGVDFTQGLTIIINDVAGKLPLTPTKDGIAWSERENGNVHQRNLMAWAGGIAQFFWAHHKNRFNGSGNNVKERLRKTIRSFAPLQSAFETPEHDDDSYPIKNLEDSSLTWFEGLAARRVRPNFDDKWRVRLRTTTTNPAPTIVHPGTDTRFKLSSKLDQPKRRVSISDGSNNSESPQKRRNSRSDDISERFKTWQSVPWKEIAQADIARATQGVLAFFRGHDKEQIFETPVVEQFPEIREEYLGKIAKPMDFRTIEEERLPMYTSIRELQDDLILVFQNCIKHNGDGSRYETLAQDMLMKLDDAIEAVDVGRVALAVLTYFRRADKQVLFEHPVVEQEPELKDAYLSRVSMPMDFRTMEEKAGHYTSFGQLEADLRLIFNNCIDFNGEHSEFGVYAHQMMARIEDAFDHALTGKRKKRKVSYSGIVGKYDGDEAFNEKQPKADDNKNSPAKKKVPYKTLEKKLRDTQRLLEEERSTVRSLKAQLRARDARITKLERARTAPSPPEEGCQVCFCDTDHDSMLICDGCENEYHIYCLHPPLQNVPIGDWYCQNCGT